MTEEQIVLAVVKAIESTKPTVQPWYQQYNLINLAAVLGIGYISWSAKRFFDGFTASIEDLYKKYNGLSEDHNHLQGLHDGLTGNSTHPCRRKGEDPHEHSKVVKHS